MLLVRLSLLVEIIDSLHRFAILLSARLFALQEVALIDFVVDEGMQLLLAHRILQVRLRSFLLIITLRVHQTA